MALWTPPKVARELREKTARTEAVAAAGMQDTRWAWVEEFNRDLERCWPGMRLIWCTDPAPVEAVAMGARPGRWGILLPSHNGGPGSVKPLLGPDDSFVEPGAWVFDMLREQDWWSPEARRERKRVQDEAERAARRRQKQEEEDFDQECLERWKAVSRAQVSMNRDSPWSQNVNGRKGARRGDHDARDR